MASSSESGHGPVEEAKESVSTSSMNTFAGSDSTEVIPLDNEQGRTQGEAEGTEKADESSSSADDPAVEKSFRSEVVDTSMVSSSESRPAVEEAKESVATSTMNTVSGSHSTGVIILDNAQGPTQGEAEGIEKTDEPGSSAEDPTEVIARGISSVLGPVVRTFGTRVEEVVRSQHTLESSINRLTRELDKLLEDTPLPLGAQHAAKLSGIRKRVGSLSDTLRVIQGRMNSMETMLSDPSVNL